MKAYILKKFGGPSVLSLSEVSEPLVETGDIRIKTECIGLNYAEIQSRKGLYGWAPKLPYILGMEAFGTIDQIGANVSPEKIGKKVMIGTQFGSYGEYIVVPEHLAVPAIQHYSDDENAAFLVNYMTAWIALIEIARVKAGDKVLIQAAAGGVGTAAVQIAKNLDCSVFGTCSTNTKKKLLNDLGVDLAIDYREDDFGRLIKNFTSGSGVDVVLEVVGGDVYQKSLSLLNPFGRLVIVGFASLDLKKWNPASWIKTWRDIPRVNVKNLALKSRGVMATHLGYLLNNKIIMQRVITELKQFIKANNIKPIIGHQFDFHELTIAHELMESRSSVGKIVIHVN
ncbi:MAG: zinc-binding dehydrogenase [Candidatus Neomarinimicrobiota bacterium]